MTLVNKQQQKQTPAPSSDGHLLDKKVPKLLKLSGTWISCALYSRKWDVIAHAVGQLSWNVMVNWIWYSYQNLNNVPLSLPSLFIKSYGCIKNSKHIPWPYIHTPKIASQIFPNAIYICCHASGDHYFHQNVMEICICLFVLTSTMKIIFHEIGMSYWEHHLISNNENVILVIITRTTLSVVWSSSYVMRDQ